ncbi:MAG: hypothetical protein M4579_005339 [Chaenotheca gracillima]|nr:MAG: hypothetical protein M4579_005339 [Chaenotheca gracillima]
MSSLDSRKTVRLDGSTLEGGGQVLRVTLALSSLTRIPVHVTKIRGNRPGGGGLKWQHLTGVTWLGKACGARLVGAARGSRELEFEPSVIGTAPPGPNPQEEETQWYKDVPLARGGFMRHISIEQETPGSIGLVFQAVLPFLLFSGSTASVAGSNGPAQIKLTIRGGTNVSFSPSYEYIVQVLLPTLEKIGIPPISASMDSRGWTHGQATVGSVDFLITPLERGTNLAPFELHDRGIVESIQVTIIAPNNARRQIRKDVLASLDDAFPGVETQVVLDEDSRRPKRLYLLLVAETETGHRLGRDYLYDEKIKDLEVAGSKLVKRVVRELISELKRPDDENRESTNCLDEYMQDQLVIFQALAKGRSLVDEGNGVGGLKGYSRPSLHTRTARWVATQILGIDFDGKGNCEGVGLVAGEDYSLRGSPEDVLADQVQKLEV